MPLPSDLSLRQVVGKYVDYLGNPVAGRIKFVSNVRLISDGDDTAVLPSTIIGLLDESGNLKAADGIADLMIPVTDDSDIFPLGWTYSVTEEFDPPFDAVSISYNLEVPTDDLNPLDLPAVSPGTPPSEPGSQPVTQVNGKNPDGLGSVTLTASDVGAADAVHGHDVADVSGLAAVATSGSYLDLADTPGESSVDWSNILNKPTEFAPSAHSHVVGEVSGLAAVATSGSYTDLTDQPSIPSSAAEVGADPAGTADAAVADASRFVLFSGTWPARGTSPRQTFFIGGSAATDEPTDINLSFGDTWLPETS